ncbi:DUF397 domain-containing protein [Saccharopolyspora sp. NPDC002686]|uniref:DUF397 domain-containing protein n=1 Tax=Saccharopolyspora sp. NPDC002686 TaxID=3154541 RepID=UPI0033166AF4
MEHIDLPALGWRKSSWSATYTNCVEVAFGSSYVAARDSKDPDGDKLVFVAPAWASFLSGVRGGRFDG